jgi:hypothetical protein
MRLTFFSAQMTRLAGLHFAPSSFEGHRDALSDLPEEALDAAVSLALRTRDTFPTPFQLRQDADAARPRVVALPDDRSTPLEEPVVFHVPQLPKPTSGATTATSAAMVAGAASGVELGVCSTAETCGQTRRRARVAGAGAPRTNGSIGVHASTRIQRSSRREKRRQPMRRRRKRQPEAIAVRNLPRVPASQGDGMSGIP